MDSEISGFYKLEPDERRKILVERTGLSEEELGKLKEFGALEEKDSDDMVENVCPRTSFPLESLPTLR